MTTTLSEETSSGATPPGRLGRPELELRTDPRSDPRMVGALAPFGMDTAAAPPPIDATAPLETRLEFCATAEIGFEALFDALMTGLRQISGLTRSTEVIQGVDGDQIQLFIARPADASGPLPCVLHLHGGGMAMLRAASTAYVRFRRGTCRHRRCGHRRGVPQQRRGLGQCTHSPPGSMTVPAP